MLEEVRDCPFLVSMHYAFQTPSKLYLILDYISGGELFTHLYKHENFNVNDVRIYIAEIVLAMEHLHMRNVIYRDIKLENILLDADGHIVITDFGLSKKLKATEKAYSFCGTIEYMAPEVVRSTDGHDIAVDWWSVGVLTYELLTGSSPFTFEGDANQQEISKRILRTEPPIPSTLGAEVRDFIKKLLNKDPLQRLNSNRLDATEIKEHPFFESIDWTALAEKQVPAPFQPTISDELDTSNFSPEFTHMDPYDPPSSVPHNHRRLFRGYSFVADELRVTRPEPEPATVDADENIVIEDEDEDEDTHDNEAVVQEDDEPEQQLVEAEVVPVVAEVVPVVAEVVPVLVQRPKDAKQLIDHIPKVSAST